MAIVGIIEKYKNILKQLDAKTAELQKRFGEIPCRNKCFTCCEQLFPVTFLEAFYISQLIKTMDPAERTLRTDYSKGINNKIKTALPLDYLNQHGISRDEALNIHAMFNKGLHFIDTNCPALNTERAESQMIKASPALRGERAGRVRESASGGRPSEAELQMINGSCTVYGNRPHECRVQGFSFVKFSEERLKPSSLQGMTSTEVPYNKEHGGQIMGCFRFAPLQHLAPHLMDYNHLYPEKLNLDFALIRELTNDHFQQEIMYYTTMCMPFLKDYEKEDWETFFKNRIPKATGTNTYSVIIDV